MKKIIMVGCTIGAMILGTMVLMIMLGVGYQELIGLTILEIIYLFAFMGVILIYSAKNFTEENNSERIPIKVEKEYEEQINYIIKNDDHPGI
jgi:hypothetical protein